MSGYDGRGAKFPLTLVRGADFALELTATSSAVAVNLSAATISGEIYTASSVLVDTMTATVTGAGSNIVTLAFTDAETALLTSSSYRWTLWVTRGGDKRPWLAGTVAVGDGTTGQGGTAGAYSVTVDEDVLLSIEVAAVGLDLYDAITTLTADTAPDVADVIPFVDVSAGAAEKVTVDNLAASTAFSGRYAPIGALPSGGANRAVWCIGDSISGQVVADPTYYADSGHGGLRFPPNAWQSWAMFASEARWRFAGVYATAGYTAAQVLSTHVPAVIAAAEVGDVVVVLAGTNGQVVDDVKSIITALSAAQLIPVAVTIPPAATASASIIASFNRELEDWCASNNVLLSDAYSVLVDTADGGWIASYTSDDVHPIEAGAVVMGQKIAETLNTLYPTPIQLTQFNTAYTGQLQTKPLAQNSPTATDVTPLVGLGTSTITFPADADFKGGYCYLFTRNNTNIQARFSQVTLVQGHRMRVGMALKATAASTGWRVRLENSTGTNFLWAIGETSAPYTLAQGICRFYGEFIVPTMADYTLCRMQVILQGAAATTISIGEVTLEDLTAMGIA